MTYRLPDYPGRIRRLGGEGNHDPQSVTLDDIVQQRAAGWPDWHPEHYCHRCGHKNISWWTSPATWNPVMRDGEADGWGPWQEIICIPCFMELAGPRSWRIIRDECGAAELIEVKS